MSQDDDFRPVDGMPGVVVQRSVRKSATTFQGALRRVVWAGAGSD
jgi:hypothetical protein